MVFDMYIGLVQPLAAQMQLHRALISFTQAALEYKTQHQFFCVMTHIDQSLES